MDRLTEIAPGVLVGTSEAFVTNSVVVAGADSGCLVIDPAVTVRDLQLLVADLRTLRMRPVAGFATHPHWDHVLWCAELGDVPRYASSLAAATAVRERSGLIEGVEQSAPGHAIDLVARLSPLEPDSTVLDWDGPEAQLITHNAHAPGHCAIFLPQTGILVAGDMCSDIEIPLLDTDQPDPVGDYRSALERLDSLPVRTVIPGHGTVGDAAEHHRRVLADRAYLDKLAAGAGEDDPRLTEDWLIAEHRRQVSRSGSAD